jgi:glycine cleavage system regulatory protein
MTSTLVMTVIGPDRTGLVDELARTVAAHGGNWQESRMCHLGGRFAGLMRVVVPAEQVDLLQTALTALGQAGLTVVVQEATEPGNPVGTSRAAVELVGQDRPGLLREVTRVLAQHQLNIEELTSERADAPFEGGTVFKARALISAPAATDLDLVGRELEQIAVDLLVDIRLETGRPT